MPLLGNKYPILLVLQIPPLLWSQHEAGSQLRGLGDDGLIDPSSLGPFSAQSMSLEAVWSGSSTFPINLAPPGKKKRHKKNLPTAVPVCAGNLGRNEIRNRSAVAHIHKSLIKICWGSFNHNPEHLKKRRGHESLSFVAHIFLAFFRPGEDTSLSLYLPSKKLRILCNTIPVHRIWRKMAKMPKE